MTQRREPLHIVDTHAGAGLYDLGGPEARRSGEAEAGVKRLLAAGDVPAALAPLAAAVRAANPKGGARFYPGSPRLIAERLRPGDHYLACELRPDEHKALNAALHGRPGVQTACRDGYRAAAERPAHKGAELVLIDPPFERPDDYAQVVAAVAAVMGRNPAATILIWLPLKDLETFDAFVREMEDTVARPALIAETRIRPLTDPMKMNGCALAVLGEPPGLDADLASICAWAAEGPEKAGSSRIWTTN